MYPAVTWQDMLSNAALSVAGQLSLAEGCAQLASEWHPSLNDKSPADVTCGSGFRAWWLCMEGACGHNHAWQAAVKDRRRGSGCPICTGSKPCVCNSLKAVQTDVIKHQWDFDRNAVKPEELLPQSNKPVHWRCNLHEPLYTWTARPDKRFGKQGTGCPQCALDRQQASKP